MTYTIARVISSKPVEGNYGPQFKIFFTTNETGEQGISMFSKYEVKVGQQLDGEITQKPGTNAKGESVTYHNFSFTKKNVSPDAVKNEVARLDMRIDMQKVRVDRLLKLLVDKGIVEMPKQTVPGTNVEYPLSSGPTAFDTPEEADISPEDIPFD